MSRSSEGWEFWCTGWDQKIIHHANDEVNTSYMSSGEDGVLDKDTNEIDVDSSDRLNFVS